MYFVELSDGTLLNLFGVDYVDWVSGRTVLYKNDTQMYVLENEDDIALVRKLLSGFTVVMKGSV